jgi:hypothetical protein
LSFDYLSFDYLSSDYLSSDYLSSDYLSSDYLSSDYLSSDYWSSDRFRIKLNFRDIIFFKLLLFRSMVQELPLRMLTMPLPPALCAMGRDCSVLQPMILSRCSCLHLRCGCCTSV